MLNVSILFFDSIRNQTIFLKKENIIFIRRSRCIIQANQKPLVHVKVIMEYSYNEDGQIGLNSEANNEAELAGLSDW